MASLHTYLTFNGDCEKAFEFYKSVFGGEFESMSRFSEMPDDPKFQVADEDKDKIMHVSLAIGSGSVLMGSDTAGEMAKHFKQGNNFSISFDADSREEADKYFSELSTDGQVIMPMNSTFWGSYFGMLTDSFGVQWMVSFAES